MISAGHCFSVFPGANPHRYRIAVGDIDRRRGDEYEIEKIIVHEDYNNENKMNDLSLIKLKSPIKFNKDVQPIAIRQTYVGSGEDSTVSGWGWLFSGADIPTKLQYLTMKTIGNDECRGRISVDLRDIVGEKHLCAFPKLHQGSCQGDSGGPLVVDGELAGVVSWGIRPDTNAVRCGNGFPDIYVRLTEYAEWIANTIEKN